MNRIQLEHIALIYLGMGACTAALSLLEHRSEIRGVRPSHLCGIWCLCVPRD